MKRIIITLLITIFTASANAQVEVKVHSNQLALLESNDKQLEKNKRLVFKFWTKIFQGGQVELIPEVVAEHYIQHNPNVPTGRQPFIDFVSSFKTKGPTDHIENLTMMTAENDIVILAFRSERKHPVNKDETYTTTWFDMFRIENGKIVEHWDNARIWL